MCVRPCIVRLDNDLSLNDNAPVCPGYWPSALDGAIRSVVALRHVAPEDRVFEDRKSAAFNPSMYIQVSS